MGVKTEKKDQATLIAEIERKKTEIWADHIHRCHDEELSEAEKLILQELDWEIKRLRRETNEHTD